jgi:hypothetical protein
MDCSTCREMMLEFVEGTLPAKVAAGVAAHVKSCPSCMKELERQSSRTRVLQSLGRVKAPDQWDEISRSIRRTGPWYFVAKYGVVAAVAGLVAAIVVIAAIAFLPALRHRLSAGHEGAPLPVTAAPVGR